MNIGNSARKLDFPLGNGDGLQKSAGCVGHLLKTSSKLGHMTSAQKCQHHVSTDNIKCNVIEPSLLMSQLTTRSNCCTVKM
jgi:hypothetical protein